MFYHGYYHPYLLLYYLQNVLGLAVQSHYMMVEMKGKIDEIHGLLKKPGQGGKKMQAQTEYQGPAAKLGAVDGGGVNSLDKVVEVRIDGQVFSPFLLTINRETTVVWKNTAQTGHTVTAEDGSFDSGMLKPGQSYSKTFLKPGVYRYYSNQDPMLRGTIQVL